MRLNYLHPYSDKCQVKQLENILVERDSWINRNHAINYSQILQELPQISNSRINLSKKEISISNEIAVEKKNQIERACQELIPWRKGPFDLFDIEIDAEWRSDLKWDRIAPHLKNLEKKTILDIGCNNGYFMFKMLEQSPELILGIDPVVHCQTQFKLIQHFLRAPNIYHELLGVEHLPLFENMFDLILSMGIIYHHRHPIQQLLDLKNALRPNGMAIIETIGIPGEESFALFPEDRYAKMRNVWFVPTMNCFLNWIKRAKFTNVEIISDTLLTDEEQRITPWSPQQSLSDFLDGQDKTKTIEGCPAPRRFCVKAVK